MSAPSDPGQSVAVWHYDGQTAVRQSRRFIVSGDLFRLDASDGEGEGEAHRLADLVARDPVGGDPVYGLQGVDGWRIGFATPVPATIQACLPPAARYGSLIDRIGLWPAAAAFALIAAIVVAAVLQAPAVLARLVPPALERQLGDAMVGDFGGQVCDGPGGRAALGALAGRIGASPVEVQIEVVNIPVVNAVTLPGGRIVIFDGLLRNAESADEVAGVLAHELGHVAHRDVIEALLRQLGLSVLLGGLDGNIGGYTNALLATAYSRRTETAADSFAIDALNAAHVSPAGTAKFFRRLSHQEPSGKGAGALLGYLSTHPVSTTRAVRFEASGRGQRDYRSALAADQWAKLKAICSSDRTLPKGPFIPHF